MTALRPLLLPLLVVSGIAGCANLEAPLPPAGSNGWQALGQVSDYGPRITPLAVIEDKQCIQDDCEHARIIRVMTRITLANDAIVREEVMTLGERIGISDGSVELVAVYPSSKPGKSSEYRFAYRFDGGL